MAGRSFVSRLFCPPATQGFHTYSPYTKAQISFSCPSDRNANNFAKMSPSLRDSVRIERLGCQNRRVPVCQSPLGETDVTSVEVVVNVDSDSAIPAGLETTREPLQGSFETFAAMGRVECNSRGCRPIFKDAVVPAELSEGWLSQDDASEVLKSRTALYHSRSRNRDVETRLKPQFPKDFAEFLNEVWFENGVAEKYFEVALQADPYNPKLLCEYAIFSWKSLKDMDKAEGLYKRALDQAPNDADILASFALFLWQSDS